jgi:hypothetical protein
MTQNSDPRENAVAERVNGILKTVDANLLVVVAKLKQRI